MKNINDLYKYLQTTNRFEGGHEIYTPQEIVEQILTKIDVTNKKIFVLYNVEFVICLIYTHKVNPENILFYSDHENKSKMVERMGVKYTTTMEQDMKFDYVIMNPPYTNGQVMLYTKFFEKALDIGNQVVSVMPVDLQSRHDKLKFHNERVLKHNIFISDNISDYFNVAYDNLRYVIADKSVENTIQTIADPLDSIPLLYPTIPRLKPIKGDTDTAMGDEDPNGIEAVWKVHKKDVVLYKKIEKYKYDKSTKKSKSPYLVFVNHTPSKGKFNCAVLENKQQTTWSMWTFAFEANTLEEANLLKSWLQSSIIVEEVNKMLTARNNQHTISKEMIERLPAYEPKSND
jgi:hypothetical protein